MLTDIQKQVLLFTKDRYVSYPEIDLKVFAAYFYDLRLNQVSNEQVMYMLFPVFDVVYPTVNRLDMMCQLFKKNRECGGDGTTISVDDIVAYLRSKLGVASKEMYVTHSGELGDVDEIFVRELLKIVKRDMYTA